MTRGRRRGRLPSAVVLGIGAVAVLSVVIGLPLGIANLDEYGPAGPLFIAIFPAIVLSLTLVGGFVALRVPSNPVGWLLEVAGVAAALGIFGGTYVDYDHATGAGLPLVVPIAWLSGWTLLPAIGMLVIYVPLLFPTGSFLSPRWRAFGLAGAVGAVASVIGAVFMPGPLSSAAWIANPLGIPGSEGVLAAVATLSNLVTPVFFFGAVASVFVRYRRAAAMERAQLKWFGLVAGIAVCAFALSLPNDGPIADVAWQVGLVTLAALPVAIGIAILRYRLWDIDRIVSRTIAWALVTAVLVGAFVGLVLVLQGVLDPAIGGNTLAVAASTLVVAALFQPLRSRVQRAVDRRFDRARYDGERLAHAFASRLRDEVGLDAIHADVLGTVDAAVRPAHAALWLRSGGPEGAR